MKYKSFWSGIEYDFVRYNYDKKRNIISVTLKNDNVKNFNIEIKEFRELFVKV